MTLTGDLSVVRRVNVTGEIMTGIGIITTVAIKIVMIIEAMTGPTRKIRVGVMTIEIMIGTIIAAHIGTILPDVIQVMRVIVMIVAS